MESPTCKLKLYNVSTVSVVSRKSTSEPVCRTAPMYVLEGEPSQVWCASSRSQISPPNSVAPLKKYRVVRVAAKLGFWMLPSGKVRATNHIPRWSSKRMAAGTGSESAHCGYCGLSQELGGGGGGSGRGKMFSS